MKKQTFKDSFRKYNHCFEYLLDVIKEIRMLKGVYNIPSQTIEKVIINVKNNEHKLGLVLRNGFDIARLCNVNNLYVNYFDDDNEDNNLSVKFGKDKVLTIFAEPTTL